MNRETELQNVGDGIDSNWNFNQIQSCVMPCIAVAQKIEINKFKNMIANMIYGNVYWELKKTD